MTSISRQAHRYLVLYCYAVEEFGLHLLRLALAGELQERWRLLRGAARLNCEEFGFTLSLRHEGRDYSVQVVPNVFEWTERVVQKDGELRKVVVPHLTALRLVIGTLETGMRAGLLRWLDRTMFDRSNQSEEEGNVCALFVNTDKTTPIHRPGPYTHRLRDLCGREVSFQMLFADFDGHRPVHRGNRIELIFPLFRAPASGRPINIRDCYHACNALVVDFEVFYRQVTGDVHVKLCHFRPLVAPDGTPVVQFTDDSERAAFCPISLLANDTSQSSRARFAATRPSMGSLQLDEIARLLGHDGAISTSFYSRPANR